MVRPAILCHLESGPDHLDNQDGQRRHPIRPENTSTKNRNDTTIWVLSLLIPVVVRRKPNREGRELREPREAVLRLSLFYGGVSA